MLNVAVWGLGNHSRNRILPVLSLMDNIRLVGVCSRNVKVVGECKKHFNCYGWIDSKQMLSSTEVDIVYIATPIGIHFSMAKQSIEAGKHVWCEKPLTCSYEETKTLVALAKRKGKALIESFMFLYHPQFQKVRSFIDDGDGVYSVICRFGIPDLDNPGFRNNPVLCGGAFWDVATYTTCALLSLFPDQKVQVLFAEIITKEGLLVDSEGRAVLRFSQGVTAYLEWGTGFSYKNEIDLWGVNGSFFSDKIFSKPKEYQPQYRIRDLNGNESIYDGKQSEQFMDMFCNFVEIMCSEKKITLERKVVLQRADLMNAIINFKGVENGKLEKC